MLLAGMVSLAIAQATISQAETRTSRIVAAALAGSMDQVEETPFDTLLANTLNVPDKCDSDAAGGFNAQSCLKLANKTYRVSWTRTLGADSLGVSTNSSSYVDITGKITISAGNDVELTRRVVAPSLGYLKNSGVVQVSLKGDYTGSVYLLSNAGSVVASAGITNKQAVFRANSSACTVAAPCFIGISPSGNFAQNNEWSLLGSSAAGPSQNIVLGDGSLSAISVTVFKKASLQVEAFAQSSDASVFGPAETANTVCLWARFGDGTGIQRVPFCNADPLNPGVITMDGYTPTPGRGTFALPVNTEIQFFEDRPVDSTLNALDGSCVQVPGQLGWTTSGWRPQAVCTSWTWGDVESFGVSGSALSAVTAARIGSTTLTENATQTLRAQWSGLNARPAAGFLNATATAPVWSKPRDAQACSATGSCTSTFGKALPEAACATSTPYCLSSKNVVPTLTSPRNGTYRTNTTLASGQTNFTLSYDDIDNPATDGSSNVSAIITSVMPSSEGTLYRSAIDAFFRTNPVGNGYAVGSNANRTGALIFVPGSSFTSRGYSVFKVTLTDKTGQSVVKDVAFYTSGAATSVWEVRSNTVSAQQGQNNVNLPVRVISFNGSLTPDNFTVGVGTSGQVSANSASVSTVNGFATASLNVGNAPAGENVVSFTANSGRTGTGRVLVRPVVGGFSLSGSGSVDQNSTGNASVQVNDKSGAPISGVSLSFGIVNASNGPAAGVYPGQNGCVSDANGMCSISIVAEARAVSGTYKLRAGAPGNSAEYTFNVNPRAGSISGSDTIAQGGNKVVSGRVLDGSGIALKNATVALSAPAGITLASSSVVADVNGGFTVQVGVGANVAAGVQNITASSGGVTGQIAITITAANGALSEAGNATLGQGQSTSSYVVVKDGAGKPLSGATVSFSSTTLTVDGTATSASDGRATVRISASADTAPGAYSVQAQLNGSSISIPVNVVGVADSAASSNAVGVNGGTFTLTVKDRSGRGVVGATLSSVSVDGLTLTPQGTTNNQGSVVINASGSTTIGSHPFSILVNGVSVETEITVR